MKKSICILGRQPALGIAELESIYGASAVAPCGDNAVFVSKAPEDIPFSRLGGVVKLARQLHTFDTADWDAITAYLTAAIPHHLQYAPSGKFNLGISVVGLPIHAKKILAAGLEIKKAVKNATGRSIRLVPNTTSALSSAQILHNKLLTPLGWELVLVRDKTRVHLCQTVREQDIEAYARRDQSRPKRDARVGMLPPKLAQVIINLALGDKNPLEEEIRVLDPFCGTGVVLQEALLMGCFAIGTDIEPRMADFTTENLHWLYEKIGYPGPGLVLQVEASDATNTKWELPFTTIASEAYLGRPFSRTPDAHTLRTVIQDVNTIVKRFLENVAGQIPSSATASPFRMCIALPAWKTTKGFTHLPVLDQLTDMGYTRMSFKHASNEDLIYHRESQVVARELVVLTRTQKK